MSPLMAAEPEPTNMTTEPVSIKDKYALYMGFECGWMMIVHQDGEEFKDGTPEFDAVFESVFPEYIY